MQRRVAIACGGTAGHIHPALAVADAYREAHPETDILFIGTPAGLESALVPARGYPLELIPGEPLAGEPFSGKLRAVGGLGAGVVAARRLLKTYNIGVVIGFGGYATAGTILAARSLGRKIAVHEANVEFGMTNRWLARLADRVYFAFGRTAAGFSEQRALVTGNPVRREIVRLAERIRERPARSHATTRFFVTGGSGGSNFLNRETPALLSAVAACGVKLEALHQAGGFPLAPIRAAYDRCGVSASVTDYIKDIESAYDWADFAVTSAGSQTLSEIAICGLPFLAVPLSSAAAGHQVANAAAFAETCDALWAPENAWNTSELARKIIAVLQTTHPRPTPAAIDAAGKIVADCERMLRDG
ncbi:MAG TPA: UDP-N-acetylglucosamine--N-acetylmuramyl-(pentapeptide) pyrophosphoryl-undecaprenol N-acetylglucosamine transferase [Candidatus Binatia bacterium]